MALDDARCGARYSARMLTSAACLEVVAGKAAGMSILVEDEMLIGRHADGAGRLADDEEISRLHARVILDADGVCSIEDLGSTNGTFVNGLRISAPEVLSVGDTIELGQTTLSVRELPLVEQPAQPTQVHDAGDAVTASDPPDADSAVPSAYPILKMHLEVDFVGREARIRMDETSEPLRLVFEDGAWRLNPSLPSEKGGHA
jgi:pSer/pThr/pTyr-binding forkhead associated (FHA) protein